MSSAFWWLMLLAAGAVLARWLTRNELIYSWDTVHYVLAVERYDLTLQQPHAPGSYYYVLLARALAALTGDAHLALQLLSCLSGALLVVGVFQLAKAISPVSRAGWLAAIVAATAPLPWFYGSLALNYAPSGTLTTWFALYCVLAIRSVHPARHLLLAGAALGIAGGFRPTELAFLAPAYGWTLYCAAGRAGDCTRRGIKGSALFGSLALAGALTLGWTLPSIVNTGGLSEYLAAIRRQEYVFQSSSVFVAGWHAFQYAVYSHVRCLESTLGAAWLLAPITFLALRGTKQRWIAAATPVPATETNERQALRAFGLLLVAPAFTFYLLGHFALPGYALIYTGYLIAVPCAWLTQRLNLTGWHRPRRFGVLLAGIAAGNAALFLLGRPGVGNVEHLRLSYPELRDHDDYYRSLGRFLRSQPNPEAVTVLTSFTATDGLRVAQTLYPEFRFRQPVARMPELPPEVSRLSWLTLMPRDQIAAEARHGSRQFYLICRTNLDIGYHRRLFHDAWDHLRMGTGPHHVLRLHPNFAEHLPEGDVPHNKLRHKPN